MLVAMARLSESMYGSYIYLLRPISSRETQMSTSALGERLSPLRFTSESSVTMEIPRANMSRQYKGKTPSDFISAILRAASLKLLEW